MNQNSKHPTRSRKEIKYYGLHACLQLWQHRPEDLIRVYLEKDLIKPLTSLLKWCAENRKAYHVIPNEEMQKVTESVHHEGICILALEPLALNLEDLLTRIPTSTCLLYLDGVQNPHNVGSIIRAAAHFGVPAILGEFSNLPKLSPSMGRIAKGGIEHVSLIPLKNPQHALNGLLREGFTPIATSSHGGKNLYQYQFPARPLIIMGSESSGVSPYLQGLSKENVMIPGTGHVESLNVAIATSLLLGEYWRQNGKT